MEKVINEKLFNSAQTIKKTYPKTRIFYQIIFASKFVSFIKSILYKKILTKLVDPKIHKNSPDDFKNIRHAVYLNLGLVHDDMFIKN